MWEIGFIALWLWCGYLASGYVFGYFQREFQLIASENLNDDIGSFVFAFVFGPVSLLVIFRGDWSKHGRLYPWQVKRNTGSES